VHADVSGIASGAVAPAEALVSPDRDQSESEPFKHAPAMPVQAAGRASNTDRDAAMPEFATPAGRPAVTMPAGEAQAAFKTPLKASTSSITFTPSFTHAIHAIAAGRMQAAASIHEPHAPAALPATTAAQIVQTIQLAWSRHGGEARITLDPEQFGDLTVAMRVDRGSVVARVQADAPQVREWLLANRDTLRAGLAEHQLRLDHLEIAATDDIERESENREAGQRDGSQPSSHPRRSRRHRPDQLFEIDA
jgi:flagellar hook-length control protein FliK